MPFPVFSQDGAEKFTGVVIFLKYYPDNQLAGAVEHFWKAIDWDVLRKNRAECVVIKENYAYSVSIKPYRGNKFFFSMIARASQKETTGYRSYISTDGELVFDGLSSIASLNGLIYKDIPGFFEMDLHALSSTKNDIFYAVPQYLAKKNEFVCTFVPWVSPQAS